MDKSDLVTFMHRSVASRCDHAPFRDFITAFLIGELNMDKSELVTFMLDSVARLCESKLFKDFLTGVLVKKHNMGAAQIVKCMKNSFAKRCIKADFVSLVDRVISATNVETMMFLFSMNAFSSRCSKVCNDVLATVAHVRDVCTDLADDPSEVARLFGKSPLYAVTSQIKDEITLITHPPDLHRLFTKMRGLDYAEQKALEKFILSGHLIADFSDFKEKRCYKRKRKTKARAEKEEETATTSTVEHKSVCRKRNVELPTGKAAKKAKITDFFQ